MLYQNPIIPGFYPDPSVCRVGEDYYLVTSSFEYFPGVPVFHSRDLLNWRQIGHCLTRASQLPLEKAPASRGIWAPTIRYHGGRFYMITTNVSMQPEQKHFIVSTDDPSGEWSEPVLVRTDERGIDPSLTFDEDGTVYFQCATRRGIVQSPISVETGELAFKPKPLWIGTGGKATEGPHLYNINGTYYLMLAEGGTEYGHMETIARSDSPWGPYEGCPHNPILSHRSFASPIQCTGHGDMVQDHTGNWWLAHLGVRPATPHCHHLGRETYLAPVRWDEQGWPYAGLWGHIGLKMEAECLPSHPWPEQPARDDFDQPNLDLCWNFLRNPRAEDWSLTERPGCLRLRGSAVTLDDHDSPAFVGRRQRNFDCKATVSLDFQPKSANEEAGLTAYMNPEHHYEIAVRYGENRKREVFVRRRIGSLRAEVASTPVDDGDVLLRIESEAHVYRFSVSQDGETWRQLAEGETRYLSSEVAGGFTGVYFGMYATGNGKRCEAVADFEWFEYMV